MTSTAQFDEQLGGLVNRDRMNDYGHPADHFKYSMRIKAVLHEAYTGEHPEFLHAMEMIADKLVRLCKSPRHLDSWIDIAGYARTAVMVDDKLISWATQEGLSLKICEDCSNAFACKVAGVCKLEERR